MRFYALVISITVFSELLFAGSSMPVPKDTLELQILSNPTISMVDMCPPPAVCVVGGTYVTFTFDLPSCVDKLGPVSVKQVNGDKGAATLYVSAYAFMNKNSGNLECPSIRESVTYPAIGATGKIKVEMLNQIINP